MKHVDVYDLINDWNIKSYNLKLLEKSINSIVHKKVLDSANRRYKGKLYAKNGITYEYFASEVDYNVYPNSDRVTLHVYFTACSKLRKGPRDTLSRLKSQYKGNGLDYHKSTVNIYERYGWNVPIEKAIGQRLYLEELDKHIAAYEKCTILSAFSHDQPKIDLGIAFYNYKESQV